MRKTAVIDNDTLVNLTKLKRFGIFDSLRSLFQQIHIPQQVIKEYEIQQEREPDRVWMLSHLRPNTGFYSLCTRYDSVVYGFIISEKNIHKGEAEVLAQQKEVFAHYIISDDLRFHKAAKSIYPTVKLLTTLHIISMLDILQLLPSTKDILRTLHPHYKFESNNLRQAYTSSAWELGFTLNKQLLNEKCSFKKLGLLKTVKKTA
jgi:predicted nucleic acid-binding protein